MDISSPGFLKLREKAIKILNEKKADTGLDEFHLDIKKLLEEFSIYQIELEMQADELQKTNAILESEKSKFQGLYFEAPVAYFTLNKHGNIFQVNKMGAQLIGLPIHAFNRTSFFPFIEQAYKQTFTRYFKNAIQTGSVEYEEIILIDTNCNKRVVSVQAQAYYDSEFKDVMCRCAFTDITQRKENEILINSQYNELVKLNADKDSFITILAHDLKSPFNSILGFLNLLTKNIRTYDFEKIVKQIKIIYASALQFNHLLDDILIWKRTQSGILNFEPVNLNILELYNSTVKHILPSVENKKIILSHDIPSELIVYGDQMMLSIVLRNLVSNAVKFTYNGGKIIVSAKMDNKMIAITVADNGMGIEPEKLHKLFDIKQFITSKGTNNEKGTGLGLLICKDLIGKHNGNIYVDSAPGKGSNFTFTLPVATDF